VLKVAGSGLQQGTRLFLLIISPKCSNCGEDSLRKTDGQLPYHYILFISKYNSKTLKTALHKPRPEQSPVIFPWQRGFLLAMQSFFLKKVWTLKKRRETFFR
jgi:hypothetical protein